MAQAKKDLVIVESPAKARTIEKYLGGDYKVIASMGHLRDLPKSKLGVDIEHGFTPEYIPVAARSDVINELKKRSKEAGTVYLATDPDREGEAISWHLKELLKIPDEKARRVTFNEITKKVVQESIANPRDIDQDLVDAQQARRILDRIVGYKLSPLLWRKVRRGLSAGRVQSVAIRMVVDRENEIRAFQPEEYWYLDAHLDRAGKKGGFVARYYGTADKKKELHSEKEVEDVIAAVEKAAWEIGSVKRGERQRSPSPPFITSTLQQEASRRLGLTPRRTMSIAQQLYEGVDITGEGTVGLITYMRTDSLRISDEARDAAAAYIQEKYGQPYLPEAPRVYKTKSSAQDAHEAIRPTMPELTPDQAKDSLTADQYKLYKLIWGRFIASQMANAEYDTVTADIAAAGYTFKASGFSVRFDGFTVLYEEGRDDAEEKEGVLPPLAAGDSLKTQSVESAQHFTQPPPRFTEASLIKFLEENGIGRPSTYAPTISTILKRKYVELESKQLKPTQLGEITTQLMEEHFASVVDEKFTAQMEADLDKVEEGRKPWNEVLQEFYGGFADTLAKAEENMKDVHMKIPDEETDIVCEKCGRNMVIKTGRYGKFLACPGFPECRNTKRIAVEMPGECPLCGGKILEKKSKKGKKFYGCEHNPECSFLSWDPPIGEKCPVCGKTLLQKSGRGARVYCSNPECDYQRAAAPKKDEEE